MMNRNIDILNIKKIYAHQLFNKDILLMKKESKDRHHFSFGEYYDEILLSGYPIEIQSYMLPIHQIIVFSLITKSPVNYTMNIQEAKAIRLADYLQSLGYSPVKQQGNSLWYKSPFREESEPSFKVNTGLNQWFDFGLGKGGNILALVRELYQDDYVPSLLAKIAGQAPHIRPTSFSFRQQPSEPSFQQLEVRELAHPALLRYLQERSIDTDIAKSECKELHFTHNGKPYFAIGFENVTGGYEVRNPFFKGCVAPKDITHIRQQERQADTCYLFEGFMDYLSFLTLRKQKQPQYSGLQGQDYMVLNSVSNLGKVMDRLSDYERIPCFFDNDQAGNKACLELQRALSYRVRDASIHYSEYKDLNDFLCGRKAVKDKKNEVSVRPRPKRKGFGF